MNALIDLRETLLEQHGAYLMITRIRVGDAPGLMGENTCVAGTYVLFDLLYSLGQVTYL